MIYSLFSTNGTLTPCTKESLEIGDRVRYAHDGRIYTVTGFDQMGAIITRDTGEQHTGQRLDSISPYSQIKLVDAEEWPRVSAEEVETLKQLAVRHRNELHEAQAREAEQYKIDMDEQIKKLRQRFPGMQPDQPGKNCKKLLQDAFPHVKFSVKGKGSSLDVSWEFGPTQAEVERIAGQFENGHFNGMEDIHEFDRSVAGRAWEAVLGRVKYVLCSRGAGDLWGHLIEAVTAKYAPSADWKHVQQMERIASEILHNTSFPGDFKEGDVWTLEDDPDAPSGFTMTFPEPEKPTTPEPTKPEPASTPTNGVTVTENADKDGVEVRFSSKPAAAILARLKDAGFRWSKFQGLWYAKRNSRTLAIAYELAGRERGAADPAGAMIQAAEDYAADSWYQANYGMERY